MTPTDLCTALDEALKTGKLGTPVAVRLHWQVPCLENEDWPGWLETVLQMLSPCFDQPPVKVQARQHPAVPQWNILLQTEAGQTIFLTLGRQAAPAPSLQLLVTGNHGTLRLEGEPLCQPAGAEPSPQFRHWWSVIRQSAATSRELPLRESLPGELPPADSSR